MDEDIAKLEAAQQLIGERLGKKEDDLQQCAKEYGRVNSELHRRIEDRTNAHEQKEEESDKLKVLKHPYVTEVLKRKVMDSDEEIQKMKNKLRQIMVLEKKMEMQDRNFAQERNRYEVELSNWRQKLSTSQDRMSVLERSPTAQNALAADLQKFCMSDEDDHDIEMIEDDNEPSPFGALRALGSRSGSPVNARSRSPRYQHSEPELFVEVEQQKPPPGPKLARPRSAFTGRRLPANQIGTSSAARIQVGSLLPPRSRPQSAPRRFRSC
jgi:hypothetical protein